MTKNYLPDILAIVLLCLTLLSASAFAAEADARYFEGSLFFSSEQQKAIKAALALRPAQASMVPGEIPEQIPESQPSWSINRLHLSALIFNDAQKWSLWFGGRQVRKGDIPPYLSDLKVSAHYIDVSVLAHPGATPVPVRLRPNQTFLIEERRIIEGGRTGN